MGRSVARRRTVRITGIVAAAAALVTGTLSGASASVDPHGPRVAPPPHASRGPAVHNVRPVRFHFHKPPGQKLRRYVPPQVTWPSATTAELALRAPAAGARRSAQGTQHR